MSLVLNREALRVVQRNDRGLVTYRKRYSKGDVVDTSRMVESHVENLVSSGALVESSDDLSDSPDAGDTPPSSGPFGGATVDLPESPMPTPQVGDFSTEAENDESGDDESEDIDDYSDMDYASLQAEAKSRDLNAGGSAEDLRARLRADDADES